jgi:hypothetical protein
MPVSPRPRDFTLTAADAERLRVRGWRRLLSAIGSTHDVFSRPLAIGLTTLGLAGLLVATIPGSLPGFGGGATSLQAPEDAARNQAGDGRRLGGQPRAPVRSVAGTVGRRESGPAIAAAAPSAAPPDVPAPAPASRPRHHPKSLRRAASRGRWPVNRRTAARSTRIRTASAMPTVAPRRRCSSSRRSSCSSAWACLVCAGRPDASGTAEPTQAPATACGRAAATLAPCPPNA